MRNKYLIFTAIAFVLLVVGVIVVIFLTGGSGEATQTGTQDPFGDTSEERLFGDTSEERPAYVGTTTLGIPGGEVPLLRLLSNEPVVGVGTFSVFVGEVLEPFARFTLGENGHTVEAPLARVAPETVVSLTTIPGVQEALWASGASTTILRYLDKDASFSYTWLGRFVPHATGTGPEAVPYDLSGSFLDERVVTSGFSPRGDQVFYLVDEPAGGTRGYIQNLSSGSRTQVWRSPLQELAVQWGSPDMLVVYTRPSHTAPGYAWVVATKTGVADQVLFGLPSLTASINPTGTHLLYSTLEGKLPSLRILDLNSKHNAFVPFVTLPEKCVWSRIEPTILYCAIPKRTPLAKEYPDEWYQGKTQFSDTFWRIDTVTEATTLIAEPEKLINAPLDAVDLTISPDEAYLLFRSKGDDRLWSLTLPTPPTELQGATTTEATQ